MDIQGPSQLHHLPDSLKNNRKPVVNYSKDSTLENIHPYLLAYNLDLFWISVVGLIGGDRQKFFFFNQISK